MEILPMDSYLSSFKGQRKSVFTDYIIIKSNPPPRLLTYFCQIPFLKFILPACMLAILSMIASTILDRSVSSPTFFLLFCAVANIKSA
ncbi:hypothetical protein XELAEV_18046474mg [Xenopus laevis]|uniref:Uncharacterized protein n=1 Tax=Xenopus laevis TaxID=8355 RepID=A0A974BT08_XENLA|nr:hypothetical protein XELAEV_18046474mg [Xenopus laevis]